MDWTLIVLTALSAGFLALGIYIAATVDQRPRR